MKRLLTFLTLSLLAGCASNPTVPENNITPVLTHTGGQSLGDSTSIYWFTSQQNRPVSLADRVMSGDYGEYRTDYRWRDGKLREIKREGTLLDEQQIKPFSLHVRYDTLGNAVFQRYTLGDELIPLGEVQLQQLVQEAEHGTDVVKQQRKDDQSLVQGLWQQGVFYRCGDERQLKVNFSPELPDYAQQQLLERQQSGYMAVIGEVRRGTLTAKILLMLTESQSACLTAPVLLTN
ncbi:DUF1481 domain-containing protein [Photobacterium sp. ZSDE20]|uniref:DUF1481 domain-containing protein n=1 Tax=Photobacterium pectinilyticum TaxID=2906793 RepID=A0ABT1N7A3_9GAMM|nr:DUF1481 domain-containing protein [Photobacterium sp. ZSDE20]MCQ1060422.1 DUF1481 domain-containing protein [Photobacterium sp. ZSDE20]MDD1827743.1 DUF1481 domain-containing protein [Photobacterium sp. ZSDE20]